MSDRQSAAIILGIFAIAFIFWYRSKNRVERSALWGVVPESSGDKAALSGWQLIPRPGASAEEIKDFAGRMGLQLPPREELPGLDAAIKLFGPKGRTRQPWNPKPEDFPGMTRQGRF